ncbi:MAG: DUF58 domain-containing protein [Lachnospiraceae bacterium]|nr:DUF58 domain-containing protein [Lachnospiraceae bacterium]
MMMDYIARIKSNVGIYTDKKTDNVFDGSYKSVYKGSSLNFEDLREYIVGDNIRDIDWKASSRSRNLLVKRYIAEKKHNIMLIYDTGRKMLADTRSFETKKDVALYAGGTIAYIAAKNGDYVGSAYNRDSKIEYSGLRTGLTNVERLLTSYDKAVFSEENGDISKTINFILKNIKRKMIVFIITDTAGINNIDDRTLKKLKVMHDVLLVNVSDADITSADAYDFDKSEFLPDYLADNKSLIKLEHSLKKEIKDANEKKLMRQGIVSVEIDGRDEIAEKIVYLLERHKYAVCH